MLKVIGLLLGASALLAAVSALDDAERRKLEIKLYAESNNSDLDSKGVEEILLGVDEKHRAEVTINGFSVAHILSYKIASCSSEALSDPLLMSQQKLNYGAYVFITAHIHGRIQSCAKNFYQFVNKFIDDIDEEDKKVAEKLHLRKWDALLGPWRGNERFSSCVRIIKKLSIPMSFYKRHAGAIELDDEKRNFVEQWYNFVETCKIYAEKQCKDFYPPYVAGSFSTIYTVWKYDSDAKLSGLETECRAIREIVVSDKTMKKRRAIEHRKINKKGETDKATLMRSVDLSPTRPTR